MNADAQAFVKRCDKCQFQQKSPHVPASSYTLISSPWPIAQWGMDIMGPLHTARGQVKYLLLAIDYFTKWVEGRALARVKAANITNFMWQEIIFRFGVPHVIITNGGPQFNCEE